MRSLRGDATPAPPGREIAGHRLATARHVSNRRRLGSAPTISLRSPERVSARGTPTIPLRAAEIAAVVQRAAVALDDAADPASPTVEMIAFDPEPAAAPRVPRGSEPIRRVRGTRRSREQLRVDEIKPGGSRRRGR